MDNQKNEKSKDIYIDHLRLILAMYAEGCREIRDTLNSSMAWKQKEASIQRSVLVMMDHDGDGEKCLEEICR